MTTSFNDPKNCCKTPLAIGFQKVPKKKYHKWLEDRCDELHKQIMEGHGKYGFRFFSGSRYIYAVKFHHNNKYDVYRLDTTKSK